MACTCTSQLVNAKDVIWPPETPICYRNEELSVQGTAFSLIGEMVMVYCMPKGLLDDESDVDAGGAVNASGCILIDEQPIRSRLGIASG